VVLVHGGPYVRGGSWGWSAETQFLASRGYAVLEPEYRGSTGFGDAHFRAGWKQWGLGMQNDIADGAKWAIAQGIADPKRLAIIGASYGGYAALAGAAFTPGTWAAAVDLAGPVDLATFLDELPPQARAELPELAEMIGDPTRDDERARLAAVSPARHPEGIAIPLLVAQGRNDPRVAAWRVDRFVAALRKRGADVEYLAVDGEGHGFRDEANQVGFEAAMADFLVRHLKP
jgi:dipeptidyl aminopeptidase/acylaminoacyl peptidase